MKVFIAVLLCLSWVGGILGQTPLVRAATNGDAATVRSLLASGANPNEVDNSDIKGWTPLMAAAKAGSADVAQLLIKAHADVSAKNEYGGTALDIAAANGKSAVKDILIAASAKGREPEDDRTAAIEAWRIEMDYVKANRPTRVNGFLVGSGGGAMGTIVVKQAISNIDSDAFICTAVDPLHAAEEVSAFVKDGQSRSMTNVELNKLAYPMVAMVRSSSGKVFTVVPAVLKVKIDIKAGDVLHSKGYAIESQRPISAGENIPVLIVSGDILSVEAIEKTNEGSEAKPWFTAFLEADISPARQ